ncbi:hypothetical protein DERF_014689 [Dermatophagoides farinae]|uniref:Uncharacterized protein n=1 Tax=Dermatophagoides farinae TaxID=6954 RepID=A0A922HMW6_DERFA|nr:hypothetical protein DERF_014689 [Dermatophagoides farinae]
MVLITTADIRIHTNMANTTTIMAIAKSKPASNGETPAAGSYLIIIALGLLRSTNVNTSLYRDPSRVSLFQTCCRGLLPERNVITSCSFNNALRNVNIRPVLAGLDTIN